MNLKKTLKTNIIIQVSMFLIIIIWGAYIQTSNQESEINGTFFDIGGILFSIFSILYLVSLLLIYKFANLGKKLFLPLVTLFIILGFLTEFFNPSQFNKDLLYLIVFYIISPIFFVSQGVIISLIFFSKIKEEFI